MVACPVCSLFVVMAASGTGRTCVIEHVAADDAARSIRLVLRLLP
jgi:guanylate kinase